MNKGALFGAVALLSLFSFVPKVVSAAILNPYVVDEKPQVFAGDSVPVGDYFGLENKVIL